MSDSNKFNLSAKEQDSIERKFNVFGKPILVLQTNGGGPQDYPVSWVRDVPIKNIQQILQVLHILHILHTLHLLRALPSTLNP